MPRRLAELLTLTTLLVAGLAASACAERPSPRVGPGEGQFLFRAEVRTPQHDAHLRLVLRFDGNRRFQLAAADLIGRTVWTFAVAGDRYLWVDHRQQRFCRGEARESVVLPLLRLELSPAAAPRILLGLLPVALPTGARPDEVGRVSYSDVTGRRWSVGFGAGGELREWQLTGSTGVLSASWQREPEGGELVLPGRDLVVRWRRAAAEPLPSAWSPFVTPSGFKESACDLGELP